MDFYSRVSDHLHNGHNGNKNEYKANDSSTPPQPFILWIYSRVSSFRYAQHSLRIQHSPEPDCENQPEHSDTPDVNGKQEVGNYPRDRGVLKKTLDEFHSRGHHCQPPPNA